MGWRGLLAWSAGIVLASLSPAVPVPSWVLASFLSIAALALLVSRVRWLAVFFLGAGWFLLHAGWQLNQQWPEERAGEVITASIQVASVPEWQGETLRFEARILDAKVPAPERILVRWFRPAGYVRPGQKWSAELRMLPPRGRLDFGGFDYTRFLLSQRIGALATVRSAESLAASNGIQAFVNRGRQYLAEVLAAESQSSTAAALMRALAIADRSALDESTRDLLRDTGTAHLLAISGLHVGMVAMLFGGLGALLAGPLLLLFPGMDRRRFSWAAAILAALGYALLAGLTLPTQRALIMLSVVAGAYLFRRGLLPGQALLLAFASVLLLDPLAVLATGFWLSFSAVAVLIWTFAWRPGTMSGPGGWLVGLLRAQLVVGVGLVALNSGLFQQIHWTGFPANLVAIPLVTFWILPSLLVSLLLIAVDAPAALMLGLCETGLGVLLDYLRWLERAGPEVTLRPPIGLGPIVLGFLGSLWLLGPAAWPGRWLGAALLLPVLWPDAADSLRTDQLEIRMLDMGEGQAILIGTSEEWMLYDTGPGDEEGGDLLGRVLPSHLSAVGQSALTRVVVSNSHASSRGGLGSIVGWVDTGAIWTPTDDTGRPCSSETVWQSGAYRFRFLHPSPGLPDLGPNSSCVLHISGPGGSVLLPGRVDAAVEQRLLETIGDLDADLLVLSAGGHRQASTGQFLDAVRPEIALASVGRYDRNHRPHREVIGRLDQRGIRLLTTGECGSLGIRLQPDAPMQLRTAIGAARGFWHAATACP
jgi:competence protein ComEC